MMTSSTVKPKRKRKSLSKCKKTINGKDCKGKYRLDYEDNIPVFICDGCGERNNAWKKFYDDYMHLYKDRENLNNKKDHVSCILGFFCYMYKYYYGTDYIFVPSTINPFGCKECRDVWTLLGCFNGNAHDVRKYIYWIFKKVINPNTNITSFGYLNAPGLIRKYKLKLEKSKTYTRASKLPREYTEWCKNYIPAIFNQYELETFNDLGALLSYYMSYNSELTEDCVENLAIRKAEQHSLIRDGKLNIRG